METHRRNNSLEIICVQDKGMSLKWDKPSFTRMKAKFDVAHLTLERSRLDVSVNAASVALHQITFMSLDLNLKKNSVQSDTDLSGA